MQSRITATVLGALALATCGGAGRGDGPPGDTTLAADSAGAPPAGAAVGPGSVTASMRDAAGRELGTVTLTEGDHGIAVAGRLTGLPPGEHGFHLHAVGRCDPPSFESAGDHWNPARRRHGSDSKEGPHAGDLSNLVVGQDSAVTVEGTTPGGTLGADDGLLDADGAAVVVHAQPDDYRTQPSGDAGDRIACGVANAS